MGIRCLHRRVLGAYDIGCWALVVGAGHAAGGPLGQRFGLLLGAVSLPFGLFMGLRWFLGGGVGVGSRNLFWVVTGNWGTPLESGRSLT